MVEVRGRRASRIQVCAIEARVVGMLSPTWLVMRRGARLRSLTDHSVVLCGIMLTGRYKLSELFHLASSLPRCLANKKVNICSDKDRNGYVCDEYRYLLHKQYGGWI